MINFDDYVGIQLLDYSYGMLKGKVELKEESFNDLKSVHGGLIMTLADTVSGKLVYRVIKKPLTTISSNTNFLSPCFDSKYILAEASIIKSGKKTSVTECKIFDGKRKLLSISTLTFFHLEKELDFRK